MKITILVNAIVSLWTIEKSNLLCDDSSKVFSFYQIDLLTEDRCSQFTVDHISTQDFKLLLCSCGYIGVFRQTRFKIGPGFGHHLPREVLRVVNGATFLK